MNDSTLIAVGLFREQFSKGAEKGLVREGLVLAEGCENGTPVYVHVDGLT